MNDTSNKGVNNAGMQMNNGMGIPPVMPAPNPVQMPQNNVGPVSMPVINNNSVVGNPNISQTVSPQPVVSMPTPVVPATPVAPVAPSTPVTPVTPVAPVIPTKPTINISPSPVVSETSSVAPVQAPVSTSQPVSQTPSVASKMPMIPNVDDLIAAAPVVDSNPKPVSSPAVTQTPVTPTPSATTPTNTENATKVEYNLSSNVNDDITKKKKEKKIKKEKPIKKASDDDENIGMHSNKAPIVMGAVFAAILLVMFVYYFVIMTPQRVFDKAINSTFDDVKDLVSGIEDSESKMLFDLGFKLNTDDKPFESEVKAGTKKPIDYIDNDYLRGRIYYDIPNQDVKIQLTAHKLIENFTKIYYNNKPVAKKENGEYKIEDEVLRKKIEDGKEDIWVNNEFGNRVNQNDDGIYTKMLDFNVYSFGKTGETYIGPVEYIDYNSLQETNGKKVDVNYATKYDVLKEVAKMFIDGSEEEVQINFNNDTLSSAVKIIEIIKEKILEKIPDDELVRDIAIKKVGGTSALALKAHSTVNHDRIKKIYEEVFNEFIKNDEYVLNGEKVNILKEICTIFGYESEEEAAKAINDNFLKREVTTQKVEVDLYMNLANTELISLNINVDDTYYVEISYLNGYYSIDIEISNEKGKVLDKNSKKSFKITAEYERNKGIVDGLGYIDNEKTYLAVKFDYKRVENENGKYGNKLDLLFYNGPYNPDNPEEHKFAELNCDLTVYDSESDESSGNKIDFNLKTLEDNKIKITDLKKVTYKDDAGNIIKTKIVDINEKVEESPKVEVSEFETRRAFKYTRDSNALKYDFMEGFKSHVMFVVDHLLYNKEFKNKVEDAPKPETDKKDKDDSKLETENKVENNKNNSETNKEEEKETNSTDDNKETEPVSTDNTSVNDKSNEDTTSENKDTTKPLEGTNNNETNNKEAEIE